MRRNIVTVFSLVVYPILALSITGSINAKSEELVRSCTDMPAGCYLVPPGTMVQVENRILHGVNYKIVHSSSGAILARFYASSSSRLFPGCKSCKIVSRGPNRDEAMKEGQVVEVLIKVKSKDAGAEYYYHLLKAVAEGDKMDLANKIMEKFRPLN